MQLQTIDETAGQLSVDPRTVRRMIARGELRAWRVGGARVIRVSRDDVEALLQRVPTVGGSAA